MAAENNAPQKGEKSAGRRLRDFLGTLTGKRAVFFVIVIILCIIGASRCGVDYNGYYLFPGDEGLYYHYGDDWYRAEAGGDWTGVDSPPAVDYTNYSLGDTWSEEWGVGDFRTSAFWKQ